MAAGEIIPWTDPGGDSCCCAEECFTDFANDPKPVYAQDSYVEITSTDYVALYAGGNYSADVDINVESYRQFVDLRPDPNTVGTQTEIHTATENSIPLTKIETEDSPCYERHSGEVTINRTWDNGFAAGANTYTALIVFSRSLGTENGQQRLSLASLYGPSEAQTLADILVLDNQNNFFPISIALRSGNMTDTVPYPCAGAATNFPNLPNVTSSFNLLMSTGGNYSAPEVVAHACFLTSNHFEEAINGVVFTGLGGLPLAGDVFGNIDVQVTFTPSAP